MSSVMENLRIDPDEIRESAKRLLADKVNRRLGWEGNSGADIQLDAVLAEMGWFQLTVAEAQGGLGQSFDVLAPIYEEMGRSLAPTWVAGTMATFDALQSSGTPEALEAVANAVEKGWRIAPVFVPAGQAISQLRLPMVPGSTSASHLFIVDEVNASAMLVPVGSAGVEIAEVETWDRGRSYGEIVFSGIDGAQAQFDASVMIQVLRAHMELSLAWDSVGGAAQCLSETVDYMLGRQQFGRAVASFQALKHRAADHKVAIELARSLVVRASAAFAVRDEGWETLATQARLLACEAFAAMGEDCVQLFGGVGFTWEYNSHLFLKRALTNQILGGSPDQLRDRVAADVFRQALAARP